MNLVTLTGEFARAVAFDMPGFGRADKPEGFEYTVSGYARFLGGGLRNLGIKKAHLVLHDFGGPFGLAWAAGDPKAFASVVLINTPPISGYRWYFLAKVWRTPLAGELLQLSTTRWVFRLFIRRGNPRGLPEEFVERMWRDYDHGTRNAVLKLYRATDARATVPAPSSFFRELDRPALLVWGTHDVYIPTRYADGYRAAFPNAEIVYLEGSGHWPFMDDPEGVSRAVLPFLRSRVAGHAPESRPDRPGIPGE